MDERTLELVAIAASVAGHCQPCFRHHLGKAKELNIDQEDIRKAVSLAVRISGIGDMRMAEFVEGLLGGPTMAKRVNRIDEWWEAIPPLFFRHRATSSYIALIILQNNLK
ncbi:MAG: carboxymuconolactone decarboxylase family protein [Chromatiales bacterium]|nr:carboxymuconolactone decarboxylase family protein [Chromatiales bacterium]